MVAITALHVRSATESVRPLRAPPARPSSPSRRCRGRRAAAGRRRPGLRSLADRLAPEHAERAHWQGA